MKTLFIFAQYLVPPDVPGGTKRYELARELARKGIDVYIFSSNFNHMTKSNVRNFTGLYSIEKVQGVHFVWMNTFKYYRNNWRRLINVLEYSIKSYRISLELTRKRIYPNVVMGRCAHAFSVITAYIVSRRLNTRFFVEMGDLWPEIFVTTGMISEKNPVFIILKKIMFYLYQKADRIICLTDRTKNYFKSNGYEKKTILLPFCIKLDSNAPTNHDFNEHGDFKVIYAGSFQTMYPLDKVIRAAKIIEDLEITNIKFVLIGGGIQKESLKTLIEELNVNNVDLLDPLPKNELLEFLKSASAFILIEKEQSYGFPNKILDYLFIGRPIIYASPVHYKVLNSGCCVKASYKDPKEIADAAIKIASMSDDERKEIALKAKDCLRNDHDVEIIAQRLIEHL